MNSNISTAVISVTPVIVEDSSELPPVTREIGADLAACDIGGAIGECLNALFQVGIYPDEVEFKVKIVPGYVAISEAA